MEKDFNSWNECNGTAEMETSWNPTLTIFDVSFPLK